MEHDCTRKCQSIVPYQRKVIIVSTTDASGCAAIGMQMKGKTPSAGPSENVTCQAFHIPGAAGALTEF
jgi:hypothetical protein